MTLVAMVSSIHVFKFICVTYPIYYSIYIVNTEDGLKFKYIADLANAFFHSPLSSLSSGSFNHDCFVL